MLKSPLHEVHESLGAKFGECSDWLMPTHYDGVSQEHQRTRLGACIFDVSHMGRISVLGRDADSLMDAAFTCATRDVQPGQCRRGCLCTEQGGILDDCVLCRLEDHWLVMCSPCSRQGVVDWLGRHAKVRVRIEDQTTGTAMVAVQGPRAWTLGRRALPFDLPELPALESTGGIIMTMRYLAARVSVTGEDGFVLVVPAQSARFFWSCLTDSEFGGPADQIKPAGIGARETLRIEAGIPSCGQELTGEIDPVSAGLKSRLDLSKRFIGKDAVTRVCREGSPRVLAGLELEGQRIARPGSPVRCGETDAGKITSGTLSPTLSKVIAMAHLAEQFARPGREASVQVDDQWVAGKVTALPFYRGAAVAC